MNLPLFSNVRDALCIVFNLTEMHVQILVKNSKKS